MFRRVLFVSLLKQSDLASAVIDSAIIFSLLHSINVLGGLPFGQMLIQLIMTFIAGIFMLLCIIKPSQSLYWLFHIGYGIIWY